ncbi:MAG: hypothetical protein JWO98_3459 [Frankiales bacterium]|nr:hypothetical protein [Frankiales bacterium]
MAALYPASDDDPQSHVGGDVVQLRIDGLGTRTQHLRQA